VVTSAIIGANSIEQLNETLAGSEVRITVEDKLALDAVTAWD
jgi:aryl-alcohol dehydrogenase-like predicted oxidoreductase